MAVKRIVADLTAESPEHGEAFYKEILDLEVLMDMGWIRTYGSADAMPVQISMASEGGSGTVVPDLSIEVDNFDDVLERVQASQFEIEYGPVEEPWGVRRFYVRDPFGKLVNIMEHQ